MSSQPGIKLYRVRALFNSLNGWEYLSSPEERMPSCVWHRTDYAAP